MAEPLSHFPSSVQFIAIGSPPPLNFFLTVAVVSGTAIALRSWRNLRQANWEVWPAMKATALEWCQVAAGICGLLFLVDLCSVAFGHISPSILLDRLFWLIPVTLWSCVASAVCCATIAWCRKRLKASPRHEAPGSST